MPSIQHKRTLGTALPNLEFGEIALVDAINKVFMGKKDGSLLDLTKNEPLTLSGDASGAGTSAIVLVLAPTGVTPGSYSKVLVDSKGRVLAGTTLSASDIPTIPASKINDFDLQVRTNRLDQLARPTSTVDFQNQTLSGVATPKQANHAANREYVDAMVNTGNNKGTVRVASTSNLNLSAPGATIDGQTLAPDNLFLAKDQTNKAQNGLYVWNGATVPATRASNADTSAEVKSGLSVFVSLGAVNRSCTFSLITPDPIVLDTTELEFAQTSGVGHIEAGAGLTKEGTLLAVGGSESISVNSDTIQIHPEFPGQRTFTVLGVVQIGEWRATEIAIAFGGTGAKTALEARANLGAAAAGNNADITRLLGLTTPLSVPQGGTGAKTLTGLIKANGVDAFTAAVPGEDYLAPNAVIDGGVY